ncbi:flavodoxin [uncultured Treponema sp.]|uniref:flavodoxin n=1 Tax=uncultured Treponema sp. TaxID=162155 RepID=UPI0025CFB4A2|nr:flavodoxin [uncultured Treponema sp.]
MKKIIFALAVACLLSGSVFSESKMILIKGGTFLMGSPASERMRDADEAQHSVTVDDFYCDAFEVRQSDYESLMGKNPSWNKGANLPVENVSFYDALEYCNRKSLAEGLSAVYKIGGKNAKFPDVSVDLAADGYRLLTEAEWEYACRAGTTTIFSTGNWNNPKDANYEGNYPYLIEENYVRRTNPNVQPGLNRGKTIAVDSLSPNAFGLYNMHGNVSEWVFDYYGNYDAAVSASELAGAAGIGSSGGKNASGAGGKSVLNPLGVAVGVYRVNRGGGFNDFGKHLRSAYRSSSNPLTKDRNLGFRIARNAGKRNVVSEGGKSTAINNGIFETKYDEKVASISIPKNPHVLVAYFSYSGNTESAAEYISKSLKSKFSDEKVDLVEIEMQNPYRGGIYDVSQRDLMNGTRPPLKTKIPAAKMAEYDVVLLGYPTWWATLPMPVCTFLESYDFSGKTVISFSSHGGTMYGDSVSDLSKQLQKSYVGLPFEFFYSGGRDLNARIDEWLKESGM